MALARPHLHPELGRWRDVGGDLRDSSGARKTSDRSVWLWVKTQETFREHKNRWYMGVHPPPHGGEGYDPWPFGWLVFLPRVLFLANVQRLIVYVNELMAILDTVLD